jgi:DNA topoisomerase-1
MSTPATRATPTGATPASLQSAHEAGLRYVVDSIPGISRIRAGKGFRYRGPDGRPVRDRATLDRIRGLVIPPAWERVWIAPRADAHIQATGRDARGRKQYRYHPRWGAVRDESKDGRLLEVARLLPGIRRRIAAGLRRPPLSRDRVLATVMALLERTLIRVGNEEYARSNGSFGLTTLRDRHVTVRGRRVTFRFRAKSGVLQRVELDDAVLAKSVLLCQELPGQTLFQYLDANQARQSVDSTDVNAWLREVTGQELTAKDFRTWAGTVLAACALCGTVEGSSAAARKRFVSHAIGEVAERLGNTKAVCRRCYVHPAVIDAFLEGETIEVSPALVDKPNRRGHRLSRTESALIRLLQRRLAGKRPARRAA